MTQNTENNNFHLKELVLKIKLMHGNSSRIVLNTDNAMRH